MLPQWDKFKGWVVLEYFLRNPSKRIHIKGLARELKISPRTSEVYCKLYSDSGLLLKEKFANLSIFFLNKTHPLSRELKKTYILSQILEFKLADKLRASNPSIREISLEGISDSDESSAVLLRILLSKKSRKSEKFDNSPILEFEKMMKIKINAIIGTTEDARAKHSVDENIISLYKEIEDEKE